MKNFFSAIIVIGMAVGPANADVYSCTITKKSYGSHWAPTQVVVEHDRARPLVVIKGDFEPGDFEETVNAELSVNNARRITFAFERRYKDLPTYAYGQMVKGNLQRVSYRLSIRKSSSSAVLNAIQLNSPWLHFYSKAKCVRIDG